MITAGIDPGATGALAILDTETLAVTTWPLPVKQVKVNTTKRARVDVEATINLLSYVAMIHEPQVVVVENPGGLPKQSAAAGYAFGFHCGVVTAAVAATGLRYHLVAPAKWKWGMGLRRSRKSHSIVRATKIFPDSAWQWDKQKLDGHAEAALMAYYGWRFVALADSVQK